MQNQELTLLDISYGDHDRQKLNLYIPENYADHHGIVLYIHGGGWIAGDKRALRLDMERCLKNGCAAASVNYRYVSDDLHMDAVLEDIFAAVQKIKNISGKFGIHLEKMILHGTSAGAHIALLYAYTHIKNSPLTPVAVIDYCGPADLTEEKFLYDNPLGNTSELLDLLYKLTGAHVHAQDLLSKPESIRQYSPAWHVSADSPPTVICHGQNDKIVPFEESVTLRNALEKNHVEYAFLPMPKAGHPLEEKEIYTIAESIFRSYIARFLN